jgi:hypothetical protein
VTARLVVETLRSGARGGSLNARLAHTILVLLALGAVLLLVLGEREAPPPVEPSAAPNGEPAPPREEIAGSAGASAAELELPVDESDAPVEREAAPAPEEPRLAELRGRLVRADGSPVAGASLAMHGWGANHERQMRFGLPGDWVDPRARSDAHGRFVLRFDPPRAYQFTLHARAPGFAAASWRWSEILPGEARDLGDVTLQRRGAIEVRIVDASGATLTEGWSVYAESAPRSAGEGRDDTRACAPRADARGVFRVEDMPPGPTVLRADSRIANGIDGPTVDVRAGETVEAEIRYTGPDNARRITVITFALPFHVVDAGAESIHLVAPDGTRRTAKHIPGSSQSHSFDDLEDGAYRVEIDDPRFLPWSRDGVRPGTSVDARLRGSAALAVEVLDDATGAAIPDWDARLRCENVGFSPREVALVEPDEEPPAGGLVDGIVPGDFTLTVRAEGFGAGSTAIGTLAPRETRRVVVRLSAPGAIAGVVRYGDGEAVPFVDVLLLPNEPDAEPPDDAERAAEWRAKRSFETWQREQQALTVGTDQHGSFRFDGLGAGAYDLSARVGPRMQAAERNVVVAAGETATVALTTPPRAFLSGTCRAPAGAPLGWLSIELEPTDPDPSEGSFHDSRVACALDDSGGYRAGPVPPGTYVVRLRPPDLVQSLGMMIVRTPSSGRELGTVELSAGENPGHDFDLRDALPGRLVVAGRGAGDAREGWVVDALRVRGIDATQRSGAWAHGEHAARAALDERGEAVLQPLFPGDYFVVAERAGIRVASATVVTVPPAGEVRLALDLRTFPGTVLVLDAGTGEPLAERPVLVRPVPPVAGFRMGAEMRLDTDAQGRLELRLAPGAYRVSDALNPVAAFLQPELGAALDWGPAGPVQAQVLVQAAEEGIVPTPSGEGGKDG